VKRPTTCAYCDGTDPNCGFCDNGVPLDTQEDWDRSWGRISYGDAIAEDRYEAAKAATNARGGASDG